MLKKRPKKHVGPADEAELRAGKLTTGPVSQETWSKRDKNALRRALDPLCNAFRFRPLYGWLHSPEVSGLLCGSKELRLSVISFPFLH